MSSVPRLPAEWEPQSAMLITWPHAEGDWGQVLDDIEPVYVAIARHCAEVQPVWIVCQDTSHTTLVMEHLRTGAVNTDNVRLLTAPYNDTWIRDYGPLAVVESGQWRLLDFHFDGWGGRHDARLDDQVNTRLATAGVFGSIPLLRRPHVLEGGSLDTDGAGTLMTTACCLLGASRNPGMHRADWERLFAEEFGCKHILWLEYGYLQGDDTDGHVDTLARFCSEDTIVHVNCSEPNDPNYIELQRMSEQLQTFRRLDGTKYRLAELPAPPFMRNQEGQLLPASYANFIIINERVLVPMSGAPSDEIAMETLRDCFPDRELIGIDSRAIVQQGGSLHCASMQLPIMEE
jgi:agmatine deiminase